MIAERILNTSLDIGKKSGAEAVRGKADLMARKVRGLVIHNT